MSDREREDDDVASSTNARETPRVDDLVAGVAHDVHNLSTHIRASAQAIRSLSSGAIEPAADLAIQLERQLAGIERSAEQASNLLGALAALGRREIDPKAYGLEALAEDGARLLARWLGLPVEVGSGREVEHATRAGRVTADLTGLVRALALLVPTESDPGLRLRLAPVGTRELLFEVRTDPGSQVDPEPAAAARARAKTLLATMDATLPLAFGDGRGRFEASIRLASAPTPALRPNPDRPAAPLAGRAGRALVAEDHAQVRDALVDTLSRCGFEVEAVGDGDTLVDRATRGAVPHDLFLVDYDLPGRNGARALEALRGAGIQAPALMISGNIDFRLEVEGLPNTDFLQKPFGLADIRRWATGHVPDARVVEATRS